MKYNVISPDGFSITFDETYNTIKEAKKAFNEWKKRYKLQGYYSSTQYGRIPLKDLESYCSIIEIN
jgi:hypothetical protein